MKREKIVTNIIKQNCYRSDVVDYTPPVTSRSKVYESWDSVSTANGIEIKKSIEPYNITPEYVNSFSEKVNYKNDLVASASLPPKPNVGDVSLLQEIMSKSPAEIEQIRAALIEKYNKPVDSNEIHENKEEK